MFWNECEDNGDRICRSITCLINGLYQVRHKVEAPKNCCDCEDFRPKCIQPCAPDSDSFQHLNSGGNVKELNRSVHDKNSSEWFVKRIVSGGCCRESLNRQTHNNPPSARTQGGLCQKLNWFYLRFITDFYVTMGHIPSGKPLRSHPPAGPAVPASPVPQLAGLHNIPRLVLY